VTFCLFFVILKVNPFTVILNGEIVSFFFDCQRGRERERERERKTKKDLFIEGLNFNEKNVESCCSLCTDTSFNRDARLSNRLSFKAPAFPRRIAGLPDGIFSKTKIPVWVIY
jgi:hypothetical protein